MFNGSETSSLQCRRRADQLLASAGKRACVEGQSVADQTTVELQAEAGRQSMPLAVLVDRPEKRCEPASAEERTGHPGGTARARALGLLVGPPASTFTDAKDGMDLRGIMTPCR